MQKLQDIIGRLAEIDWGFSEIELVDVISLIHPYPARFTAALPRTLIRILGVPSDTAVLDPFCGSGTTLLEAHSVGIPAVGIDLNPIACLISRVATTPLTSRFLEIAEVCANNARWTMTELPTKIPNLDHWFKKNVQLILAGLLSQIDSVADPVLRDALRLAFSSIVVRVSNQESDTRYAAINKKIDGFDVLRLFTATCHKIAGALSLVRHTNAEVQIIEKDIFEVSPSEITKPVGLVVTSPPYPNAYEYWLYHKYRMWWLGYNPLEVRRREIGARAHFFKKNHHTKDDFRRQMDMTLKLVSSVLVQSGHACFVIGNSKIHGELIDNAGIIEDVADSYDMQKIAKFNRTIMPGRKSFNLSHARIKEETILVLKKN
jgi:site-specific DNA-methyltransferase (cytosine-N4-specific)